MRRPGRPGKDGVPSSAGRGVGAAVAASAASHDMDVVGCARDSAEEGEGGQLI